MRIRQFIAALMILLSLSAQARTVFACAMMPGAGLEHCCCPAQGKDLCPGFGTTTACCDQVTATDAPFSHVVAASYSKHHVPVSPLDLPPPLAPDFRLVLTALDAGHRAYAAPTLDAGQYPAVPLYLQTARLRL